MNELSKIFLDVSDAQTVILEKDKIYHVRQDDSFEFTGYFCTNTAKKHENPDGLRRTAIFLKEKNNITIDGNGATMLVHGKMTPFLFDKCNNITVKNLTVDYACPTMAEFRVESEEDGKYILKINHDCLFRVENNELIWHGEKGADGEYYWEDSYIGNRRHIKVLDTQKEICNDFRRQDLPFETIEQLDDNTLCVTMRDKSIKLPVGGIFQTRNIVRDQTGSLFNRCKNLRFENLRVKFMHGLGMVSQFCENVSYINCDFTPAEGRTIASTADFFQFSGCKGQLLIDSCKANGAQDDYVNVHGTHLRIVEKNDDEKSITVRFMHNESWGFQAFEKGDELEFIRWDTLIPYAQTKVVSYEKIDDTDIMLHLDRELPDIVLEKDVVENTTWTPDLHVVNCDFGVTAGRGILCTTRGRVVIENNTFSHLWGPALLIEDDCNFWFESGYTKEIIFRNNHVVGCEYGNTWEDSPVIRYSPKVMDENSTAFVHGKLVLEGNRFEKPWQGRHCICLNYLENAEIENNTFDAPYFFNTHCVGKINDNLNTVQNEDESMILEKQIVDKYKKVTFRRCDDNGTARYFSYEDFDGLKREKYDFASSLGHKLSGNIYYYENYNPDRLVIFEHGFGGGHRSYMREIELLCRHGFRVFAYDHTGCMESGGENPNGMSQSLRDLDDCMKTLKADDEFRNLDFSVIGHSWGGFSSLNITALHPEISHVVVLSGFTSVKRLVDSIFSGIMRPYRNAVMELEKASNPDYVDFDAVETLKNTESKILLIYSDNDPIVRRDNFDVLKSSLDSRKNIEFILENNKSHNPNYTSDAVGYLGEYTISVKKKNFRKVLRTDEQKKEFVDSFDWNRMTAQDEKVWQKIFKFLDK